MAELSPAAQAVLRSFWDAHLDQSEIDETPADLPALVAAFRAAAKSLKFDLSANSPFGAFLSCQEQLNTIASELEWIHD